MPYENTAWKAEQIMTHHCAALRAVVAVGRLEPQAAHGVKHG